MSDTVKINSHEIPAPPYQDAAERDEAIGTIADELGDVVRNQDRLLWWIRSLTAAITAGAVAVLAGGCTG